MLKRHRVPLRRLSLVLSALYGFGVASSALAARPPIDFKNPGGMWMPSQISLPEHQQALQRLGLQIPAQDLADPQSGLMQAIVSLDGCSGSFISPQGLIITNHHCVDAMLSYFSQEDQRRGLKTDHVRDGFRADALEQERNVGPSRRIFVTNRYENVTQAVLGGLETISDPAARSAEIDRRVKLLIRDSEARQEGIKTEIKSFYGGEQYFLIERLEIKDVRMVYAPPKSVGAFAEDPRNWKFPRHTGDFAVLRAYVGRDGKPAAHSPENVPYQPPHHLNVSGRGLEQGSLVMVAGFPGVTYRLSSAQEVRFQVEHSYPLSIQVSRAIINRIDEMGRSNDERRKKLESLRKSLMNRTQKFEGALDAMRSVGFLEEKVQYEREFQRWIDADLSRQARFGQVLQELEQARQAQLDRYDDLVFLSMFASYPTSLASAMKIVKMAEERAKSDDLDRDFGYQRRDWERLRQSLETAHKSIDLEGEIELMALIAQHASRVSADKRPAFLAGAHVENKDQIRAAFATTRIEDLSFQLDLFDHATTEQLRASTDSVIQLALRLREFQKMHGRILREEAGRVALLMPRYMAAMREYQGRAIAPDANSTLRVTYGQVKGYSDPLNEGAFVHPFTTADQMVQDAFRNMMDARPGQHYNVPQEIIQAIIERRLGVYADPQTGQIPLNFVADVDTTGGNSGSAALNAKGELVGLLFDGTLHSLARDWRQSANGRSVLLDIRFVLWLLTEVYHVDHVMKELTVDNPSRCEMLLGIDDIREGGSSAP